MRPAACRLSKVLRTLRRVVRELLIFGLTVGCACLADARTWTVDGATKVKAEFSGLMGDIVFLNEADGSVRKVHLSSLAPADQAFIKNGTSDTTSVVSSSPSATFDGESDAQPIDMAPGGSKPLAFRRVIVNIEPGTTIGKYYIEPEGIVRNEMKAPPLALGSGQFTRIAQDELQKAHYNLLGGENLIFDDDNSAKARYQLGAQISGLRLNIYSAYTSHAEWVNVPGGRSLQTFTFPNGFEIDSGMTTDWQVYDTLTHKIVYEHTTEISTRSAHNDDTDTWFLAMFRKSLRQLLANDEFANFMKSESGDESQTAGETSYSLPLELGLFHREKALALPTDFSAVLESVVLIKPGAGFGTGFIVTEDGYALTAAHVVSGLKTVSVRLQSGLVLDADVIRVDQGADVALIKIPGSSHKPLELFAGDPTVGLDAYAIGSPLSEELASSVTKGVISGEREIEGHKYLQTDVSANPGNSGGPLVGKDGRVFGIISWKIAAVGYQGLAFAVPVSEAIAKLNLKALSTAAK
jgi:serine protease Do